MKQANQKIASVEDVKEKLKMKFSNFSLISTDQF